MSHGAIDAAVIGSGPNGLAAAVVLARSGLRVEVFEAQETIGGGARTLDLGLAPGLRHDVCSAVHPSAAASPFFRAFDLRSRGVELRYPDVSYAQPMEGRPAGLAYRDLDRTAEELGVDGAAWRHLLGPLARHVPAVVELGIGDKRRLPADLLTAAQYGLRVLEQGTRAWDVRFRDDAAPALLTGVAMHAITPQPTIASAGASLLLAALAHSPGWPLPVGGSQAIVDAMVADIEKQGGVVHVSRPITALTELPKARAYIFDTNPQAMADIAGDRFPDRYAKAARRFRYGDAAAKVNFVVSGPVPWADGRVGEAGTVHVGGTRAEMAHAEMEIAAGRHAERPNVLMSDPVVLDPAREVNGLRPLWVYAHVPHGSTVDVGAAVQAQIERFAPGFSDLVVQRRCIPASEMSGHNANYVGGDIAAGAITLWQMFARPAPRWDPYGTPDPAVFLCSSSTPNGPAVHGMGGLDAARRVLRRRFGIPVLPPLAP